jgi:hypothetical protein
MTPARRAPSSAFMPRPGSAWRALTPNMQMNIIIINEDVRSGTG